MKIDEIKNCCNIDLDEISRLKKLLSNSYDELEFNKKTEIFKALSDPTRLQILSLLTLRDLYVCEVMAVLDKPQSTISHHLNVLRNAGFIKGHKEGIWTLYGLENPEILILIDKLCDPIQ